MTDRMLVATTPTAVVKAHVDIAEWARLKMHEARLDLAVERENLKTAERCKWSTKPFRRNIRKCQARVVFLEKLVAGVEAGLHIVPNFYMSIFAIRTDATKVKGKPKASRYGIDSYFPQAAKSLPAGDGRYVSPQPTYSYWKGSRKNSEGNPYEVTVSQPVSFLLPDYPVCLAKPELMAATERAQLLGIMDEIGIAEDQSRGCGDPMILGRINQPYGRPSVTFFIAWALPLDSL